MIGQNVFLTMTFIKERDAREINNHHESIYFN